MIVMAGTGIYILKNKEEEIGITSGVSDEIGAEFVKLKIYDSFSKYVDYMNMIGKAFDLKLTHGVYECSDLVVKETARFSHEVDHELSVVLEDVILRNNSKDFSTIELVFKVDSEMKITERRR